MKKLSRRAADWSIRGASKVRPTPAHLISAELTNQFSLPKLDHVMWLSRSAELGIIALDSSGCVIEMNLTARELIVTKDGIIQNGRSLEACLPGENTALADAIRGAVDQSEDSAFVAPPVSMLRISRNRASSLLVAVVPSGPGSDGGLAAVLIISDPERPLHESVRMLCELYHLTPGETRLTEHLIDGFTLAEIAEILVLKPSTVRVYLKQIFAKTGVNRQAMLIRLFLTSRIPFDFPDTYPIVSRTTRASTMVPERLNS